LQIVDFQGVLNAGFVETRPRFIGQISEIWAKPNSDLEKKTNRSFGDRI